MQEKRSVDSILEGLKEAVGNKGDKMMNPEYWNDAAFYLAVLLPEEHDKLFKLENDYYLLENKYSEELGVYAKGKVKARASQEYVEYQKQSARVKDIERYISLAKSRARTVGGF